MDPAQLGAGRVALGYLAVVASSVFGGPPAARAQSYTWGTGGASTFTSDYNLGTNWSTTFAGAPPVNAGQTAIFSSAGSLSVTVSAGPITPDSWTFDAAAQNYTFIGAAVNFNGAGPNLVNNASGGQSISIGNNLTGAAISQAGVSTLTLSGTNSFTTTSVTAGTLANIANLTTTLTNSATFINIGTLNGSLTNTGTVNADGTINGNVDHQSGSFTAFGPLTVNGTITTGSSSDLYVSGGDLNVTTLVNNSSAMIHATWIDAGRTLNATTLTNNGNLSVSGTLNATNTISNAIGANIVVDPTGTINGSINAAGGYTQLYGTINGNVTLAGSLASMNTYGGSVTGRVALTAAGANVYSISGGATYGSIAGVAGTQVDTGAFVLTVGGDNSSSTFAGALIGSGGFVKTGSGIMSLTGDGSAYTGSTTVTGGTLVVDGSMASSSLTTVNATAALAGIGAVGALQVNAGGIFSPGGAGGRGTSMTVASLTMQSGALFSVFVDPATSSFANVTGSAALGGATVGAHFAAGSYVAKQYTILNASSISSHFDPTVANTGLPSGFHTTLSYDTTHAYLNLALNFTPPSGNLNGNQQNVGNAIINYFNANGTIPMAFGGLTPAGLTQLSGEVGSAPQQTTFNAMSQFMGVMTDPLVAGRGDPVSAGGAPNAYAEESMAYATRNAGRSTREREAYAAIHTKAPPVAPGFEQRWSVWAAGFGGSQPPTATPSSARTARPAAFMAPRSARIIASRVTPWRALRSPAGARISPSRTLSVAAGPICSRRVPSSATSSDPPT